MDTNLIAPPSTEALVLTPVAEPSAHEALVRRKRAEFAHLAPQYELQCFVATLGRIKTLRRQVAALAKSDVKGPVLELCCGTGGVTSELARLFDDVTGVDLSPDMLARAARRIQRERLTNVRLREAEVSTLRFPAASFSAVVISLGLHELPRDLRDDLLKQVAVWLKPGGRFVFCDYVKSRNPIVSTVLRLVGRLVIEEKYFGEYMDYSIGEHFQRFGLIPVERGRQFLSSLEVSAWTVK